MIRRAGIVVLIIVALSAFAPAAFAMDDPGGAGAAGDEKSTLEKVADTVDTYVAKPVAWLFEVTGITCVVDQLVDSADKTATALEGAYNDTVKAIDKVTGGGKRR